MKEGQGCTRLRLPIVTARPQLPDGPLVDVTDRAREEIQAIFASEAPGDGAGLRIGVIKGGCSGLSYDLAFSERRDSDVVVPCGDVSVLVDEHVVSQLAGITLDYEGGLKGKGFVFRNPNASRTCACGDSFRV